MTQGQSLRTGPVLLVEDSPDDLDAVRRAFRKVGFAGIPDHVCTGEDAMKYLRSSDRIRPSVILLDLNMRGMGGHKTLEMLKQDKDLKDIPVVVLTTSDYDADIKICYSLGANTYIQKPVDFDLLCRAIRNIKEYWFDTAVLPRPASDLGV